MITIRLAHFKRPFFMQRILTFAKYMHTTHADKNDKLCTACGVMHDLWG